MCVMCAVCCVLCAVCCVLCGDECYCVASVCMWLSKSTCVLKVYTVTYVFIILFIFTSPHGHIHTYNACTALNPRDTQFYRARASSAIHTRSYASAINDYTTAIAILRLRSHIHANAHTSMARVHNDLLMFFYSQRGSVYRKMSKFSNVVEDFSCVIEMVTHMYTTSTHMVHRDRDRDTKEDEHIHTFMRALKNRGYAYATLKKYRLAAQDFTRFVLFVCVKE